MNNTYKYISSIPYSLHDMITNKIKITDDNIKLYFKNGFIELKSPYKQVVGNILIEKVDLDFSKVYILSSSGKYGSFKGKKMSLTNFIKKYKKFRFEIIDEIYGYNQVSYCGYLYLPNKNKLKEIIISIYYSGNIVYETI